MNVTQVTMISKYKKSLHYDKAETLNVFKN